jgi:hypothetical protein
VSLNPGHVLSNGQYRILSQLGRGGFGFVYRAQDVLLGQDVAIKELIPALVGDEATLKRFLAEAKATMRLTHERIVRTHNVFSEGANYYIVMEFMAGGSLEDRLRGRGPLPVGEAVRIAAQVCDGLAYAHREGVVHCDLKPPNILFDASGSAKVADFGIAHVSGELLTRTWQTSAGFVAGTLPYMSPEQADGVRDDPRIDIYALGAVLYRMLVGRPYLDFDQRETPGAQADNVLRIRSQEPKPLSTSNQSVPAWLDAVVLKALAKNPVGRYANTREFRNALLRKGTAVTAARWPRTAAEATPAQPGRKALPGWFWPLAGLAAVLSVILFVALWALVGGGDGSSPARVADSGTVATSLPAAPSTVPLVQPSQPVETATVPTPTGSQPTEVPRPTEILPSPTAPNPTVLPSPTATTESVAALVPSDTPPPTATPTKPPTEAAPPAQPVAVFGDGFQGSTVDSSRWSVDPGAGEVIVKDGAVRMRSDGRRFPYIYSRANPFPAQDGFEMTARFHYVWVKDCGVGVIMSSVLVPAGLSQDEAAALQQEAETNGVQAGVWQDRANGLQLWFRSGADRQDIRLGGPNDDWNEMTIRYSEGRYTLLFNGSPVYTSQSTPHRPQYIWMGHPADLGGNCWWSTLEVDEIRVSRLP